MANGDLKFVAGACKKGKLVNLRSFDMENDLPIVQPNINIEEINQFLKTSGPLTLEQEKKHFEKVLSSSNDVIFSIIDKTDSKFIGLVGLHEINWRTRMATTGMVIFFPEFWGKGFGMDAMMLVMDYAFNRLNLHRLNSSVIAFNERSAGCLLKCGYKEEGRIREYHFRHGQYYDQIVFGALQKDFKPVWDEYSKDLPKAKDIIEIRGKN